MKKSDRTQTWEKTKVQNLVRHRSGRYYARTFGNNKEIWKSLRTEHLSVAKARLAEFLREHREKQAATANHSSAEMTFAEALAIHLQNLDDDVTIKPTTRHYWKQVFASLLKSWPGLAEREVRRITKTDCTEWARRFRKVASSTRYNNTIAGLRHVFDVAIEAGIIYGNPAAKLERVPVRPKQLTLPSRAEFLQLVEAVERAGAWCSRDCADFLRGQSRARALGSVAIVLSRRLTRSRPNHSVYQTPLPGERRKNAKHADQRTRICPTPAITNYSIKKRLSGLPQSPAKRPRGTRRGDARSECSPSRKCGGNTIRWRRTFSSRAALKTRLVTLARQARSAVSRTLRFHDDRASRGTRVIRPGIIKGCH